MQNITVPRLVDKFQETKGKIWKYRVYKSKYILKNKFSFNLADELQAKKFSVLKNDFENENLKNILDLIEVKESDSYEQFKTKRQALEAMKEKTNLLNLLLNQFQNNEIIFTIFTYNGYIFERTGKHPLSDCYNVEALNGDIYINALYNDFETASLGGDMKINKNGYEYYWSEDKNVTSKLNKNSKLNRYITNIFNGILIKSQDYYFKYNNRIFNTNKFNSMFGYCVEYTSKLLLDLKLNEKSKFKEKITGHLNQIKSKNNEELIDKNNLINTVIVREAIENYQTVMKISFNLPAQKIRSISFEKLIDEKEFTEKIIKTAEKINDYIVKNFNLSKENYDLKYLETMKRCDLSILHISALADFIIDDTILDLKYTSCINERYVKQVLTYYWLSQKFDLNIRYLVIYEAITDRWIKIDMKEKSIKCNYK